jgi:hypothetical protein
VLEMATYLQIQNRVRKEKGFVPKSCWIAHVKSDYGLTKRIAPNRIDTSARKHPCPGDKRKPIVNALKYFQMI